MLINGDKIVTSPTQSPANSFVLCGKLTAATTTAVGGVLKLENTYGVDLLVLDMVVQVTTKSTGAATVDVGVDDGGDVSNDTLFDGLDVGTAAGIFDNRIDKGTNGGMAVWKKGEFLVATASATTAGMVGTYKIIAMAN
jgi:hypothetical protein